MSRWTPERRAKQAAAIHRWTPWTRATGPRTEKGKARSSRNAWKGRNRDWWRAMDTLLKMYRKHPGAKTPADCEPLTPSERAALETYDRLHPDRMREIWIDARKDPSQGARMAQEFRARYPDAKITVVGADTAARATRQRRAKKRARAK